VDLIAISILPSQLVSFRKNQFSTLFRAFQKIPRFPKGGFVLAGFLKKKCFFLVGGLFLKKATPFFFFWGGKKKKI